MPIWFTDEIDDSQGMSGLGDVARREDKRVWGELLVEDLKTILPRFIINSSLPLTSSSSRSFLSITCCAGVRSGRI